MISLDKNKNIGIFFQPRSGSTVLQNYLTDAIQGENLGELFNFSNTAYVGLDYENTPKMGFHPATLPQKNKSIDLEIEKRLGYFKLFHKRKVVKISTASYIHTHPQFTEQIKDKLNMQFINLVRGNLLDALISYHVSFLSKKFHHSSSDVTINRKLSNRVVCPLDLFDKQLHDYVEIQKHIHSYFDDIPTLYYEQFKDSPIKLIPLFDGFPKKIINCVLNASRIKNIEYVENYTEVTQLYRQFVMDNSEWFPQYFGKISGVTLPLP